MLRGTLVIAESLSLFSHLPFQLKRIYLPIVVYFKHKIKLEEEIPISFLMAGDPTTHSLGGPVLFRQFSKINETVL
jgi:hypothetical protein